MTLVNTYTPIATITLTSTQTSAVFSSIPQIYTDLVLESYVLGATTGTAVYMQFNTDTLSTNTNYSYICAYAQGATPGGTTTQTAVEYSSSGVKYIRLGCRNGLPTTGTIPADINTFINSYSSTTTGFKTAISESWNNDTSANSALERTTGSWHNTSAINTITILTDGGSFAAGSSFSLYGITAA